MKKKLLLILTLFVVLMSNAQINFDSLPKYDCDLKKWTEFNKDTIVVVKPDIPLSTRVQNSIDDFIPFFKNTFIIKTEKELTEDDLKKSLFIVGRVKDFKRWKQFELPIHQTSKGFIFNKDNFDDDNDAIWFNDSKRIVVTANSDEALQTLFDCGQLGMDFFMLQKNQLTYFGNITVENERNINVADLREVRKENYTEYKELLANFFVSKNLKKKIDLDKVIQELDIYTEKYANFFDVEIPKSKVNVLIHTNLLGISNMTGWWNLTCGNNSRGMNVLGEIHCVGANQGLVNHEISHHIFNSNVFSEYAPDILIEGVVEVFTNVLDPKLFEKRLKRVHQNFDKFNFKELFEEQNAFYNNNSSLHYALSGIWVKYFIDVYGVANLKKLYQSDDTVGFLEQLSGTTLKDFTSNFQEWVRRRVRMLENKKLEQ